VVIKDSEDTIIIIVRWQNGDAVTFVLASWVARGIILPKQALLAGHREKNNIFLKIITF